MKGKYIIVEDARLALGFPSPVLAADGHGVTHLDLTAGRNCVAAGFWHLLQDGTVSAHGESTSLGLKSRGEEDARLIFSQFNSPIGAILS